MMLDDDHRATAVMEADINCSSTKDSSDIPAVYVWGARGSFSVAQVKILDVIKLSEVSIRLRNWVTKTSAELPVATIGAYGAGYPKTEKQFLKIKNLGRKSVYELTTLLKKWDHVA